MIVDIVQTVLYLGVAGYAAHRVENAWLARNGYDTRDFFKHRKELPPTQKPTVAAEFERYALQADHEERQKLLASPTGWLLDPFRYPTNPHIGRPVKPLARWVDPIKEAHARLERVHMGLETYDPFYVTPPALLNPVQTYRMVMADPPCPACGSEHTEASATHGRSTSMWWCRECTAEFTLDGETKKSKKARKSLPPLPCGHTGGLHKEPRSPGGFMISVCDTCSAEWWPRSNDPTGRTLAQSEIGFYRNGRMHSGQEDVPFDMPPPPSMR